MRKRKIFTYIASGFIMGSLYTLVWTLIALDKLKDDTVAARAEWGQTKSRYEMRLRQCTNGGEPIIDEILNQEGL